MTPSRHTPADRTTPASASYAVSQARPHHSAAPWLTWPLSFILFWALWMCFVDSLTLWEILSGLGAAAAGVAGAALFKVVENVHFHCTWHDVAQLRTIAPGIIADTFTVLAAAFAQIFLRRPAGSHMRAVPFDMGQNHPTAAARRTLAVALPTITPNTIILGLVESQNLMLFHQIKPQPVPQIAINLGAQG